MPENNGLTPSDVQAMWDRRETQMRTQLQQAIVTVYPDKTEEDMREALVLIEEILRDPDFLETVW